MTSEVPILEVSVKVKVCVSPVVSTKLLDDVNVVEVVI